MCIGLIMNFFSNIFGIKTSGQFKSKYFRMKRNLFTVFLFAILAIIFVNMPVPLIGQGVVISEDLLISAPHPSSILDVRSDDKGILIPGMTTIERNAIVDPANGLLVYDTDVNQFFYYDSTANGGLGDWLQFMSGEVVLGTGGSGSVAYYVDETTIDALPYMMLNENNYVQVTSKAIADDDDPIFEVKNKDGHVVLGVYQSGVRILVDDSEDKSSRGTFAVGGFTSGKDKSNLDYLRVTPDSVRVYVVDDESKSSRGGFAVGGFTSGKGFQELFRVTADSTRVYVRNTDSKSSRGGFAVGGFTSGKENEYNDFLFMTPENYFIGHNAGLNTTPGAGASDEGKYNSFIGYESGKDNTVGKFNTFLGYRTGYVNNTGSNNVFIGYQSGLSNGLSGDYNVFIGFESGKENTSGKKNTFIGHRSGASNKTSESNVFIGDRSGEYNIDGNSNVFIGVNSGNANVDGTWNAFLGNSSGFNNISGRLNTFIGNMAGQSIIDGSYNTFVGTGAGVNTWGNAAENTAIGLASGQFINGEKNSYLGGYAGCYHGSFNTAVGYLAGDGVNGSNNVFIGYEAGKSEGNIDDKLYIANAPGIPLIYGDFQNGRIGLGTINPAQKLSVNGNIILEGGVRYLLFTGGNAYIRASDANRHIYFQAGGLATRMAIRGDNGNIGVGTINPNAKVEIRSTSNMTNPQLLIYDESSSNYARLSFQNASGNKYWTIAGITNALNSSSYLNFYFSEAGDVLRLSGLGRAGIMRAPTANEFEVNGDASKTTAGSWLANSDARIKVDVSEIEDAYDIINKLRPVRFKYSDEWKTRNPSIEDKYYYNFIAQEFIDVFPESVKGSGEFINEDKNELLQIDSYNAQIVTIKAVQQLINENTEQKEIINDLLLRLTILERKLAELSQ